MIGGAPAVAARSAMFNSRLRVISRRQTGKRELPDPARITHPCEQAIDPR